jgi:hypothetical protein
MYDVGTVAEGVADAAIDWAFEEGDVADASAITETPGQAEFYLIVGDQRFLVTLVEVTE